MKKVLCLILLCMTVSYAMTQQQKPGLAVLPFTGGTEYEGEAIAERFSADPKLSQYFRVYPITSIRNAIDKERNFQVAYGMTEIEKIGKELGVEYIVSGNITLLGGSNLLVVSIIKIANLELISGDIGTFDDFPDGWSQIFSLLPGLANNVIKGVGKNTSKLRKLAVNPVEGTVNKRISDTLAQILAIYIVDTGKYAVYPRTSSLEQVSDLSGKITGETTKYVLSINARDFGQIKSFYVSIQDLEIGNQERASPIDYQELDATILPKLKNLADELTGKDIENRMAAEARKAEQQRASIAKVDEDRLKQIRTAANAAKSAATNAKVQLERVKEAAKAAKGTMNSANAAVEEEKAVNALNAIQTAAGKASSETKNAEALTREITTDKYKEEAQQLTTEARSASDAAAIDVKAAIKETDNTKKRVKDLQEKEQNREEIFLAGGRKLWSIGLNTLTSMGFDNNKKWITPYLNANANLTIPFLICFWESGVELCLFHTEDEFIQKKASLYYFTSFNFFLPFRTRGGLYLGFGGGLEDNNLNFKNVSMPWGKWDVKNTTKGFRPSYDFSSGLFIPLSKKGHSLLRLGYAMRIRNFKSIGEGDLYNRIIIGYTFRFF